MKLYFSDQDTWVKNTSVKLQPGDMLYSGGKQEHGYRTDYWLILSGKHSENMLYNSCQFKGLALYVGNGGQKVRLQNVNLTVNHLTLHAAE